VTTKIEFYQRLREHIPEEAARLIAEEVPIEKRLATKDDLDLGLERLRSSMFRWNLLFFVPLWIGVYATLVTILVRGV
jgi:hypothetical protein